MRLILLFTFLVFSSQALAQTQTLGWQDLQPEQQQPDVKLPELSETQRELMARLVMLRQRGGSSDEQSAVKKALAETGIDADAVLAARQEYMAQARALASRVNTEHDGKSVLIPGFLVPLELDGEKGTEFLLVPTAGACIHTPPPPKNQIVLVSFQQGYQLQSMSTPVWVEGKLSVSNGKTEVFLMDGTANVDSGYKLKAKLIKPYEL